jgi:hypothetical protein
MELTAKRESSAIASFNISKRCAPSASPFAPFNGGLPDGIKITESKAKAANAPRAEAKWPAWTGLKHPP